jgi:outer membrane protein OmpA-like peptidoglycan-associated protein
MAVIANRLDENRRTEMSVRRILFAALVTGAMVAAAPARAQNPVSADAILKTLKPAPLTRSLGGPKGLNNDQKQFVDELRGKTRAITVVEREKLTEIVEQHDLPATDLEILFDYNSAAISSEAMPQLVQLGLALRGLDGATILLNGHTDAVGSNDYNQTLSEARAQSVRAFLVKSFNIDPYQLIAVGYGEEQLKVPSYPEAAENRRVQIVNMTR